MLEEYGDYGLEDSLSDDQEDIKIKQKRQDDRQSEDDYDESDDYDDQMPEDPSEDMAKRARLGESSDDEQMEVDESESNSEVLK